jgi:hypothetical protein
MNRTKIGSNSIDLEGDLVGRPVAVVVVGVVETVFGAKEQCGNHKEAGQYSQYEFDIHGGTGDDKRNSVMSLSAFSVFSLNCESS